MHEFSISSEIVKAVIDTAEKNKGEKVLSVQLEIGELTLLNREQVTFWVQELFRGTVAEGTKIKVKTTRARIRCEGCGYQGKATSEQKDTFQHLLSISCPKCRSFQVKIEKGKECILRKIQMVR